MRRRRLRRAFLWTLGVALLTAPVVAIEPSDNPSPILSQQLIDAGLDAGTRASILTIATGLVRHEATFTSEGLPDVSLQCWLKPSSPAGGQRIVEAARLALGVFVSWYGAVPPSPLVVIEAPWNSPLAGAAYRGVIVVGTPFVALERDMTIERSTIGAVARQYLSPAATHDPGARWFDEGLALYAGTRAIHEALENRNFATVRYFGRQVPFVIRALQWSNNRADARPALRYFAEIDEPASAPWRAASAERGAKAQRAALALHTLERYLGWPAMQQALAEYRIRATREGGSPALLNAIVSQQRGGELAWFFNEAFREGNTFDYAIDRFASEPAPDLAGRYRTTIGLRRVGPAVFTGTNEAPIGPFEPGNALDLSVTFADGSIMDDSWSGRQNEEEREYLSPAPAIDASIDPRAVLLLDADRANNTRRPHAPIRPVGVRLAMHWLVWLQDVMLSYSALG